MISIFSMLRWPKLSEELGWRLKHLNSQWDALEKILLCGVNNGSEDLSRQIPSQEQQVPSLEEPYTTGELILSIISNTLKLLYIAPSISKQFKRLTILY